MLFRSTELAVENDAKAQKYFLNDSPIPEDILLRALRESIAVRRAFPVYLGAAALNVGIRELLDGIMLLPRAESQSDSPLSGLVYKVEHDKLMGKAAHVRLFSGAISNREPVPVRGREKVEKVTQIRRVLGQRTVDMGQLTAGDIGVLYGLSDIRIEIGRAHV